MLIESTRNETIKRVRALTMRKGRLEQGLHFIEGDRLVREAVISGAQFCEAFVEEGHDVMENVLSGSGAKVYRVTRSVMESMAQTGTPQWVCATVKTPDCTVPEYYPAGLIIALDGVQDPGNLGTIIRTADAMGAVGIFLGDGCADPFAPKPLRSSMGSVYHIPIWDGNLENEIRVFKSQCFSLICGHLGGGSVLPDPTKKCLLVIGNEGKGVCDSIADQCEKYRLPMFGFAESLNASVAAGILIYEIAKEMHK